MHTSVIACTGMAKDLKDLDFCLWCHLVVAKEPLEVCGHRATICLHSCALYCVIGDKREAIWCVELVHR